MKKRFIIAGLLLLMFIGKAVGQNGDSKPRVIVTSDGEVDDELRFFFIWEQDSSYQAYIRPHLGKYNILTNLITAFFVERYAIVPDNDCVKNIYEILGFNK